MTVYLDHNATAPLREEVRELWVERLGSSPANPSSLHAAGRTARAWIDEAREQVAEALNVPENGVIFTPSGSAANNLALLGGVRRDGSGLVVSSIEHAAVLEPAAALEREGHPVARLPVDREGRVAPEQAAGALEGLGETPWVSVMAANNEVGTCQQLADIGDACRGVRGGVRVHTDAVQALGRVRVDLGAWGVNAASFSAHKVGGPVGLGVLVLREDTEIDPLVHGGGQERGLVAGTEDAARCSAGALAIELAVREQEEAGRTMLARTRELWSGLRERIPGLELHGRPLDAPDRLPNTLNVGLPGLDGRILVTRLDLAGLATSAGSACASGAVEPSHVLLAMGFDESRARSGLRLSCHARTTREDVRNAIEILARVYEQGG